MKNIKIFAFLAIFLLSAAVSSAWAVDVTLTYKINVQGTLNPVAHIYNVATGEEVASWDHGLKTLWPANEGHTMNDDYKITFTPNRGLDKTGENENNKSTSTTAFRTEKITLFTVSVGEEGFYFKSVTFKEDNTEKASSSNIAPNSTSIRVEVPENKFFNYITVVLTNDAYTVSVPENLTVSAAFATINGVKYYKAGKTVTLTAKENEIINTITGVTASNENVTINLAADRKTATFKMPSEDVTITATTTEVHTVSVPDGITLSDAFINISGTDYYKKGQTVTFGFSGSGSVVYFVNGERIEGNSVTVGKKDLKVEIGIPYIDENGKEQIRKLGEYTVLTSLTDVSNLGGGWYVVQGKVKYSNQVKFSGDAHLILADGAEMVIESKTYGIQADKNLTIYGQNGQSDQSGTLKVTATGLYGINSEKGNITISGGSVTASGSNCGIYSSEGVTINGGIVTASGYYGIYNNRGNITINGGIVTATGTRGIGINGSNGVTINGGIVTATGYNSICNDYGNITISGGIVTATGTSNGLFGPNGVTINGGSVTATGTNGYGIYSQNRDITLGWTNSTVFIKASSYKGSVQIAEGKSFKDDKDNVYSGTLTGEQLSAIKGKKLEPCYAVALDLQDGKAPVMLPAAFDENGVAHVTKPENPTRDGFTFEGWFTTKDGNTEFDFSAAITGNTTAYAKWSVPYIDENGKEQIRKPGEYTVLKEDNKPNEDGVIELSGGWYVVEGEVKYTNQVTFNGDAHLILADGATIEIKSEDFGIYANENLTIYGQGGQSGTLNVTALDEIGGTSSSSTGVFCDGNITINGGSVTATSTNGVGIYSDNGVTISGGSVTAYGYYDGIYSDNGRVTISGGTVEASGENGNGIYSYNGGVTISGGTVEASGENGDGIYSDNGVTISGGSVTAYGYYDGIYSYNGGVTISGGSVTATGNYNGIYNDKGNITLGWTNSTDFIKVSSIHLGADSCTVSIAEGKSFKDEKGNVYSGTLTGEQIADIKGKTLVPPSFNGKFLSDVNVAVADIPMQKYADGKPVCPSVVVTDGKDTLSAGTDYAVTCVNNTAVTSANLDEAAIAQITGKGSYAGEIEKRFFIWENIGNYAAVQVYKDGNDQQHAEIDGAYDGTDAVKIDEDMENVTVKFNRTFTPNSGYATIMLPFDYDANNLDGVKSVIEFMGMRRLDNGDTSVGMAYVWCNKDVQDSLMDLAAVAEEKCLENNGENCEELGKFEHCNESDYYADAGKMVAYTPYMVQMGADNITFKVDVTLKATVTPEARVDDWVFRGTLAMHEWTSDEMKNTKIWGFAAQQQGDFKIGEFVPFGAGAWILPFRAFMEYDPDGNNGSSGAPVPKGELGPTVASIDLPETMEVVIVSREGGEEHTTVIGRLNTRTGEIRLNSEGRRTFDLKGRSVGKPRAKGIYLKK